MPKDHYWSMAKNNYTKEFLEPLVRKSLNWADVCRAAGVKPATGAQSHLAKKAKAFDLDYSHFKGLASNKGKKFPGRKTPLNELLVTGSTASSDRLRKRLILEGIKKPECELCGITTWRGKAIPLELDHINSNHWDNRLENLQVICPNCHAQETAERKYPSGGTR